MKKVISVIFYVLRNEKKKILFFMLSVVGFLFVLFPFGDLADVVTAQIAKATNNQVFVQFSNPGFSIFPSLGFELRDVHVETNFLPAIQAKSLTIAPSIKGLLTFKPGVKVSASKILGGDVDVSVQQSTVGGKTGQLVNIEGDNVELSEVLALASSKLPIKGKMSVSSSAEIDPSFQQQPTAQVQMQVNRFDLASDTIATPLGPLNLPPLSLNRVNLQGELKDGRFTIDQMNAGQGSDELTANVKGRIDVRVQGAGEFIPGAFDFEIRLTTKDSFQQKAGLFLSFLSSYKKPSSAGTTQYAFRVKGQSFRAPPNITAL